MNTQLKHELTIVSLATVDGHQRESIHRALQPILFELIGLGRSLKQLHWNVTGPHFRPIHLHLDEIYALVDDATDQVAERLAATGHSPNGRMCDVTKQSEIEDMPAGFINDAEVLLLSEHTIRRVVGVIRYRITEIETVDTSTADLLHQIVLGLEKHHWMIAAHRVHLT